MVEILLDMRRDASRAVFWFFETLFVQPAAHLAAHLRAWGLYGGGASSPQMRGGAGARYVAEPAPVGARRRSVARAASRRDVADRDAAKAASRRSISYGFGLEKLGLMAVKWPRESFVLLLFFTLFCGFGLTKLQPHGVLSELFRSQNPIYQNYKVLGELFPTSEYDTLVMVKGDDILAPEKLEQLRTLHLELQFVDGVAGVLSLFSMRTEPDARGNSKPLIPDVLPKGKAYEALKQKILAHPLVKGRLFAKGEGGQKDMVLLMLSIKPEVVRDTGFGPMLAAVQKTTHDTLRGLVADIETPDAAFPSDEEMQRLEKDLPVDEAPAPEDIEDSPALVLSPAGAEMTGVRRGRQFVATALRGDGHLATGAAGLDALADAPADVEGNAEEGLETAAGGKDLGLEAQFSGVPMMQHEIRSAIKNDRIKFNVVGFALGTFISFLFFRRPALVFIASVPPAIATLWVLGLLGHSEQKLSTLMNVIPPLIMVIAFSDSMHMVFSIRRRILAGMDRWQAARHAVTTVGPACVLTSITTSIALLSLSFTDSDMIRQFAYAAATGTLMAFLAVVIAVPTLAVLILRDEAAIRAEEKGRDKLMGALERGSLLFARWLTPRFKPFALVGVLLVGVFGFFHLQLEPRYAIKDQVPDSQHSMSASKEIDARLNGTYPIHVLLSWKGMDKPVESPEILAAVYETHKLLESEADIGNVWSIETMRRWLESRGVAGEKALRAYLSAMPKHLYTRFVNDKGHAALVTGRIRNMSSQQTMALIERLNAKLAQLQALHPNVRFTITGLTTVSSTQSTHMIAQLNMGFLSAIVLVILFIGLAFRSAGMAVLSVIPNLFPIVAIGTFLYLMDDGLRYASVLALTVAFGLAVDDTIHFLNRYAIERRRTPEVLKAVRQTIARIGPVLVLTTMVLVCGLSVTALSSLPVTRLFGELSMATLSAALVADLILLPAIILAAAWLFGTSRKGQRLRVASA